MILCVVLFVTAAVCVPGREVDGGERFAGRKAMNLLSAAGALRSNSQSNFPEAQLNCKSLQSC